MKTRPFTATGLRFMLSVSLFLVTGLGVVGFYFASMWLEGVATDVGKTVAEAHASQNNVQTLQKIQNELSKQRDIVERASSIVAESKSYQYQDQIIKDLSDYAARAGVGITNIDFGTQTGGTSTPIGGAKAPTTPTPAGVKSTSVSVTIKDPVDYNSLLRFIRSIEQNLTKMQISRVGLSKESSGGLTSDILTIEVYIR